MESTARYACVKANPPTPTASKVHQCTVINDVAHVSPACLGLPVYDPHVDVAIHGGENEPGIRDDNAGYRAREAAETVAMVGVEGADLKARGEVEEADGAISEAASEVGVRQGKAAARQPIWDVHVGLIEVEGLVKRSPSTKILSCSMMVHVFLTPRGVNAVGPTPYDACETVPQWIIARDSLPRGTNLHANNST